MGRKGHDEAKMQSKEVSIPISNREAPTVVVCSCETNRKEKQKARVLGEELAENGECSNVMHSAEGRSAGVSFC